MVCNTQPQRDFISLSDGEIIPLCFDSKAYYLNYFISKSAMDDRLRARDTRVAQPT